MNDMRNRGVAAVRFLCTVILISCSLGWLAGCGNTNNRNGTEQLLVSDAVDRSVAQLDFSALTGQKVYLDTSYIKNIKGIGFVNSDYIISSLRQQMIAARCLLHTKADDADYIVEARVGTLGTDSHDVTYGIPASNALSAAASIVSAIPTVPTIPEISIAKRTSQNSLAKIVVFAYNRATHEPVWQSGMALAQSTSQDVWLAGAGPFQSGTIYEGPRFAGSRLKFSNTNQGLSHGPAVQYDREYWFVEPRPGELADSTKKPSEQDPEDSPTEDTASKDQDSPVDAAFQPPASAKNPEQAAVRPTASTMPAVNRRKIHRPTG